MDEAARLLAPVRLLSPPPPVLPGHSIYRKDGDIMQSMGMLRTAHMRRAQQCDKGVRISPGDVGRRVVRAKGGGWGKRIRALYARSICRECDVGECGENSRGPRY